MHNNYDAGQTTQSGSSHIRERTVGQHQDTRHGAHAIGTRPPAATSRRPGGPFTGLPRTTDQPTQGTTFSTSPALRADIRPGAHSPVPSGPGGLHPARLTDDEIRRGVPQAEILFRQLLVLRRSPTLAAPQEVIAIAASLMQTLARLRDDPKDLRRALHAAGTLCNELAGLSATTIDPNEPPDLQWSVHAVDQAFSDLAGVLTSIRGKACERLDCVDDGPFYKDGGRADLCLASASRRLAPQQAARQHGETAAYSGPQAKKRRLEAGAGQPPSAAERRDSLHAAENLWSELHHAWQSVPGISQSEAITKSMALMQNLLPLLEGREDLAMVLEAACALPVLLDGASRTRAGNALQRVFADLEGLLGKARRDSVENSRDSDEAFLSDAEDGGSPEPDGTSLSNSESSDGFEDLTIENHLRTAFLDLPTASARAAPANLEDLLEFLRSPDMANLSDGKASAIINRDCAPLKVNETYVRCLQEEARSTALHEYLNSLRACILDSNAQILPMPPQAAHLAPFFSYIEKHLKDPAHRIGGISQWPNLSKKIPLDISRLGIRNWVRLVFHPLERGIHKFGDASTFIRDYLLDAARQGRDTVPVSEILEGKAPLVRSKMLVSLLTNCHIFQCPSSHTGVTLADCVRLRRNPPNYSQFNDMLSARIVDVVGKTGNTFMAEDVSLPTYTTGYISYILQLMSGKKSSSLECMGKKDRRKLYRIKPPAQPDPVGPAKRSVKRAGRNINAAGANSQ